MVFTVVDYLNNDAKWKNVLVVFDDSEENIREIYLKLKSVLCRPIYSLTSLHQLFDGK